MSRFSSLSASLLTSSHTTLSSLMDPQLLCAQWVWSGNYRHSPLGTMHQDRRNPNRGVDVAQAYNPFALFLYFLHNHHHTRMEKCKKMNKWPFPPHPSLTCTTTHSPSTNCHSQRPPCEILVGEQRHFSLKDESPYSSSPPQKDIESTFVCEDWVAPSIKLLHPFLSNCAIPCSNRNFLK
jgi:hypothetical protein